MNDFVGFESQGSSMDIADLFWSQFILSLWIFAHDLHEH